MWATPEKNADTDIAECSSTHTPEEVGRSPNKSVSAGSRSGMPAYLRARVATLATVRAIVRPTAPRRNVHVSVFTAARVAICNAPIIAPYRQGFRFRTYSSLWVLG